MAVPPQQFCVRWNSYHTNLQTVFPRLLLTEQFADVTLACESRQLRCHKLVLSACSGYLEQLLLQNPCKHPIVLIKDMRFSELQALVDFMYKGEVNVTQDELPSLLKSAEGLQIRGLCSGEASGLAELGTKPYSAASDALLAHAQRDKRTLNGPSPPHQPKQCPPNGTAHKKRKGSPPGGAAPSPAAQPAPPRDVKEETVEEDGLYYGELDNDHMDYNEDEDSGKPGSSLGQSSEFAIANVQCQYDSPSDGEDVAAARGVDGEDVGAARAAAIGDHTYDRADEPPAFIIQQVHVPVVSNKQSVLTQTTPYVEVTPSMMTLGPGYLPSVNVIHLGDARQSHPEPAPQPPEYSMNKRIRRSELVLKEAADCVSRGLTFQTVSERFNIPISTIRFFMARKGILPRRRRGRHGHLVRPSRSPEPPFHMQHFKLPDMLALKVDADDDDAATT